VRRQDPATREPSETAGAVTVGAVTVGAVTVGAVTVGELAGAFAAAAPRLRVCYAAAHFAETLRGDPYGSEVPLADLFSGLPEACPAGPVTPRPGAYGCFNRRRNSHRRPVVRSRAGTNGSSLGLP
jgi:hypothetical protein